MDEIPELSQKMSFLYNERLPRQVSGMGDRKGLSGLCELLQIPEKRTAIRDQIGRGVLDSNYQSIFATRFDFSLYWDEWRRGKTDSFKKRYQEKHKKTAEKLVVASLPLPVDTKNERLLGLQLKSRHDGNKPWQEYDLLASLQLFSEQPDAGESRVHGTLICRAAPMGMGKIAIKSGKIKISCGEATISDFGERNPDASWPSATNDAGNAVAFERSGTSKCKVYAVKTAVAYIGEVRLPKDSWRVTELAPGDVVEMSFSVFIRDLETEEIESFMRPDGKPISEMRQAIIERLNCAELVVDKNGWIEVCGDAIRYEQ